MAKAILLVRVSTERQSFDEQERQLYDMAVNDGYADSDIIPIAEKESGIKLSEENRKGLQRMKEVINDEDVAVVYAWEISRIARKKKILFSILDFLTERKIQLIIREPSIRLLNDDGTINESGETQFTLFAQMAESEMRNKAARFKRAKKVMAEQMKFSGGASVKFGYTLNDNKVYKEDPQQAEVVRLIYRLYLQSDMGYSRLSEELKQRGIELRAGMIATILSDRSYMGECVTPRGLKRRYPIIIDRETWEKVEAKRGRNDKEANKSSKYFFGSRLIVCPDCGHHYIVTGATGVYKCMGAWSKQCDNGTQIKVNTLDSLLWYDVRDDLLVTLAFDKGQKIAEYQDKINVLNTKIAACETVISGVESRLEKVGLLFEKGVYTEEKMLSRTNEIKVDETKAENDIKLYQSQIENYETVIKTIKDDGNITERLNRADDAITNIENLKEMYSIIHTFISKVEISEHPMKSSKFVKQIDITHVSGQVNTYFYYYRKQTGVKMYYLTKTSDPYTNQQLIEREILAPMEFDEEYREIIRIPSKYVPTGNKRGPKKGTKYNRRKS